MKTCKARIETNDVLLSLNMDTTITLTKLAMLLQLLRYEFLANVELRKTYPSVRPTVMKQSVER